MKGNLSTDTDAENIYILYPIWIKSLAALPLKLCKRLAAAATGRSPWHTRAWWHLASTCPSCPLLRFLKAWSPLLRTPRVPSNKLSTDQYRLGFSDASPSAFPHLLSQAPLKLRAFSV